MAQHVSSRINILSGHLAATAMHPGNSEVVERNSTRAESRPAPGGGAGTLTITDNRTGKQYTVKVGEGGTINAAELKRITAGGDGVGLRTYDPGYVNTAACISRICYIDGDKGILRYRGYPIEQLAEKSNFLEVAYLLVYGELPTQRQQAGWKEAVMRHSELPVEVEEAMAALPPAAHPMAVLLTGICALSTLHPEQNPVLAGQAVYSSRAMQDQQIVRLLGTMPAIAARAYHKSTGVKVGHNNQRLSYAENFLYLLDSRSGGRYRPHPAVVRALDVMFILHAEHEMNCSTAAARHLASSGVDVHIAIAGAVGALYGPLHGGANEAVLRMLRRIGSKDRVPEFISAVKGRTEKLYGFGHRVYKNFDPRAKIIRDVAQEVFTLAGHDPLIEVAEALQAAALADPYFIDRKLYPNVDFFSGLVYQALGFPPSFFTVLFALPRVAGYLSHWRESLSDPDTRIMRPQQDYRGVWLRDFTPLDARQEAPSTGMSELPPSKAHLRRVAGIDWQ